MNGIKSRFLFDTDVLIDFLRGQKQSFECVVNCIGERYVSTISIAELYAGVRNIDEERHLENLLTSFVIIHLDAVGAKLGGELKRQFYKSHRLTLPDALIAATAITNSLDIYTLNVKHYPMFTNLQPAYIK